MNPPLTNRTKSHRSSLLALACAASLFASCGEEKAAAPVAPPPAPVEKPAPAIDAAVKAEIENDATRARAAVDQARELKQKGLEMERATRGSGKETFSKAASLYSTAMGAANKWCEPSAPNVNLNAEQREYYCAPLCRDSATWLQEAASLTPLMQR